MSARVAVVGAAGNMGLAIIRAVSEDASLELSGGVASVTNDKLGRDLGQLSGGEPLNVALGSDLRAAVVDADVVIDFSTAATAEDVLAACTESRTPLVLGTTGLSKDSEVTLTHACKMIPVVAAANTSIGVAVMRHVAMEAAKLLGTDYDIEVVEMHHRRKVDAPSGTAVMLANGLAQARGLDPAKASVHGRSGPAGPRPADEIGVMTLRGGDVVGEHTVFFAGPGERLEVTHRAQDRSLFARGAVRAAKWLVGRDVPAGRYGMADVLGLGT